jgi:hypothetical protein
MRREARACGSAGIGGSGVGDRGIRDCLIGLGRIDEADTYQATYPIFAKKKIGYSCTYRRRMDTYPYPPVHINGVADTYQHPVRIGYGIRSARDGIRSARDVSV